MLELEILLSPEGWDEEKQEFVEPTTEIIQLEHSLVSLKKWESKWNKPFLSKQEMTTEETLDYIKCMTISQNVNPEVYGRLSTQNIEQVRKYIAAPMSATTFSEKKNGKVNRETITAEIIYYWMIAFNIPSEYQNWHLNQLLTLIRVCSIKNQPTKKRSGRDSARNYAALNKARREQYNTRG